MLRVCLEKGVFKDNDPIPFVQKLKDADGEKRMKAKLRIK
jgi:hypothetical protein